MSVILSESRHFVGNITGDTFIFREIEYYGLR